MIKTILLIKKVELYNRFIEYINKYKTNALPTKKEINSQFIEELIIYQSIDNLFYKIYVIWIGLIFIRFYLFCITKNFIKI